MSGCSICNGTGDGEGDFIYDCCLYCDCGCHQQDQK